MKLLYTLTAYPPAIGGAQLLMHQLACQLRSHHDVRVVAQWNTWRTDWLLGTTLRAPAEACAYEVDGIPVQTLTLPSAARHRLALWVLAYYAVQGPAIRRISRALAAQLAPWATDVDLIHNCRIGREGLSYASLEVARRRSVPFVLTPVHHPRWAGWLHRHYQRLYRLADAVIALTEAERETLVSLGVREERIFVTGMGPILASGGDGDRFRARHGLPDGPVVLFVGQKYAYKGVGVLLAAADEVWRRLPDTQFVFVGPRTAYSRRRFARVADARVLELGAVDLQEKTDAIAACDVLCLPSAQESFGAVFTEAWSLGKPVVGCDIPAVRAVIAHERDGLLPARNPDAVAEALVYLLESAALRAEMGRRGQEKVQNGYTWARLAEKTEAVYRQVLTGRG
ncbi:MAG: glycosyl transferase family 1 [Gemmatimonadetes bacterium RIFCSPLOWO2_02_FULL_71_11]|nr:MAG: glycosyl transferase family 1 [Gemmatimonadetes bacterium RIFCSPLOWO2_02_FULL_71_11]